MTRNEQIKAEAAAGVSYADIAKQHGISPARVHQIVTGYKPQVPEISPDLAAVRWRQEADGFTKRLADACADKPFHLPSNIKPPSDYNFAHGVLTGYVTGLSREAK